jgi:hypothetical protein
MKIEIEPKSKKQKKKLIEFLKKKEFQFKIIDSGDINKVYIRNKRKRIDVRVKKTEAGWIDWMDKITFTNVPKWFDFIEWLFLLGAMSYLVEKTNSVYIKIIYAISYVFLSIYVFRYFLSIDYILFPFIKSVKIQLLISVILGGLLGYASHLLIQKIIPHFIS